MRQNTNTDQIYVGDFKGMATSGGTYAATPEYLQELTNASVTKDGTLKPRKGSTVLGSLLLADSTYVEAFAFSFAGQKWLIQRYGTSFIVSLVVFFGNELFTIQDLSFKTGILLPASTNEPATYAVKTDGNYCHVLVATKSTQMVAIVLSKRDAVVTNTTGTTATASYGQWYTNALTVSNTKTLNVDRLEFSGTVLVGVSNSTSTVTFTWDTKPAGVVIGTKLAFVSCFWNRFCDANYYQGSQLFNTALRRNTVPLDANVELPELIRDTPIYNEPKMDVITAGSAPVFLYNDVVVNAVPLTKNATKNPTSVNEWDYSDGAFRPGGIVNRSITHVAFGALATGNVNTRVFTNRIRKVLFSGFETVLATEVEGFVDKTLNNPGWFSSTAGRADFFGYLSSSTVSPGVPLDSVVEIVLTKTNTAGAGAVKTMVDISDDNVSHTIGDGFVVPLYGYGIISKSVSNAYPNVVRFVGNRLVLTGNTNKILVSSADWNYRGYTFNNMQVTSLDYTENSPYILRAEQTGADIVSLESVNGVMLVFNEAGCFRITGKSRNEPPNAITASVAKLTNYTATENCTIIVDNKVYFANNLGLFSINYSNEQSDGVVTELSLPVSEWFANVPTQISYSPTLDSLLVKVTGQNKLLRFNITTGTWSYVHVAVPYALKTFKTYDGFFVNNGTAQLTCVWSNIRTADLADINFYAASVFAANTQTIATTNTPTPTLVSSHELMQSYAVSGVVVPTYGNGAKAVGSASVVTEATNAAVAKPIIAHAVTKALYTDKSTRGIRLRSLAVYIKGVGLVRTAVTGTQADTISRHNITVNAEGAYTVTGAKQKNHNGLPTGDTVVVVLSDLGISNAYNVAFELAQGTEVIGFALDTSAKSMGRLE